MYCTVVTASRSAGIANGLTYVVGGSPLRKGMPVEVPLKRKIVEGIVLALTVRRNAQLERVRAVAGSLSEKTLLTEAQMQTLLWMAEEYCSSLRQALSCFLPPPPWKALLPSPIVEYRLQSPPRRVRGKKQTHLIEALEGREWISEIDLLAESGADARSLRSLVLRGIAETRTRHPEEEQRKPSAPLRLPELTQSQRDAVSAITGDRVPSLLFGVTASGKTEVYAQVIADTVRAGKQAILLVPEILLTEQVTLRFTRLLGKDAIAVLHSKLPLGDRRRAWRRIHSGDVALVIGSRSALFAPVQRLGLVIIDEEHEWTYKNEQSPRYHARETAETLCRFAGATLLLGSATPSLETWSRAKSGRYRLVRLSQRYAGIPAPSVRIIDLTEVTFGDVYPFSPPLFRAIDDRLQRGEQAILFLNRRGMASSLLCFACRRRVVSPLSQLPFTVHHDAHGIPYLLDHTSGLRSKVPERCPHCGSPRLHPVGAGTQRIESLVRKSFPGARILRADSDVLRQPAEMRSLLREMLEGKADILIGTQTVVKGLDLPNVTLAAVLLADTGLSLPHFRAGERTFQLLMQLTGRSGRARPGEVLIQTFRPDAPEIRFAMSQDAEGFLEQEMKLRIFASYPPATRMARILFKEPHAERRAREYSARLQTADTVQSSDACITVSPTFFGGGKEWHVLLRCADPHAHLASTETDGVIDVDPMECL